MAAHSKHSEKGLALRGKQHQMHCRILYSPPPSRAAMMGLSRAGSYGISVEEGSRARLIHAQLNSTQYHIYIVPRDWGATFNNNKSEGPQSVALAAGTDKTLHCTWHSCCSPACCTRAWQVPMAAMATHNFSCVSFKTALSRSVSATTRRRMLQNPPRGLLLTWLEMKNLHPSSRNLASQ